MHLGVSLLLIAAVVYRAISRKSLTLLGSLTAAVTALIHAIHPWSNLTMSLLLGFYILGTWATKVKHDVKSRFTVSSSGGTGSTTRTHVQVLANSMTASLLIGWHAWLVKDEHLVLFHLGGGNEWRDALMVGVMAHYAATTSDTLSSELGILATSPPRLITNPFRVVLPGTNGGVTLYGLLSGTLGSLFIGILCVFFTPFAPHSNSFEAKATLVAVITAGGVIGTLLDSFLGATLQASIIDVKRNKIVEADGGVKVLVHPSSSVQKILATQVRERVTHGEGLEKSRKQTKEEAGGMIRDGEESEASRKILVGRDLVSNNAVNMLMAGIVAALGIAWGVQKASL